MSSSPLKAEVLAAASPLQLSQLERLAVLLQTAPLNLLSPRDRELVWERHVGESVLVCQAVAPIDGERWVDVGTGGGLPGLVLAIMRPSVSFTLIDARQKKIGAVRTFVDELGLDNVTAVAGRAEHLARSSVYREAFDGAISRALGALGTVVELSRAFVRPGGRIVAVRGGQAAEEARSLDTLASSFGVQQSDVAEIEGTDRATWLVTMRTHGRVPRGIPRSDGLPASRPLNG